jgi:hypothetical protein
MEKELKALDEGFTVIPNPNRPGLANIFYHGQNYDLPVISMHTIKDEVDHGNRYEFPNGMSQRHHTRPEILARIEDFLKQYKGGSLNEIYG